MTNVKRSIMWRVGFCLAVVFLFAIWVSVKMFTIQLVEGDHWMAQSDSLTLVEQDLNPARGNIYSDNGSLLATSMPNYEIRWDASVINQDTFNAQVGELAILMAGMFPEHDRNYYRRYLVNAQLDKARYKLIRKRVTYHQLKEIKSWPIFRKGRFGGGFLSILTTKRVRPAGALAFRTIGYSTQDNPGVGLERSFETELGGLKGKRLAQKISGAYRPLNDANLVEPQNGKDVHTTINIDFQEIAHRALNSALVKHKADHGCVVVMEVQTGKIKAISNLKFDGADSYVEEYNYAIGESYEPGSVWKVFSAMAVLEAGYIQPKDCLNIYNGVRSFYGEDMQDSDKGRYRKSSFTSAFARSSNVALSSVVFDNFKNDPHKYISYLKKLNLHQPTGINILGEGNPFINQPSSSSWSKLTLPWLAIGYENLHTPLQLLSAYNAVINDGKWVKPQLVDQVTDAGIVVEDYTAKIESKKVCSSSTSSMLRDLTKAVVQRGTARNINTSVVQLAGKSGTAQIAGETDYQTSKQYNASFVGHFPADDPVYSVYVMVNRPSNGQYYSTWVAAPIFKEVAEKIYTISVNEQIAQNQTKNKPKYANGYSKDINSLNTHLGYSVLDVGTSDLVSVQGSDNSINSLAINDNKMPKTLGMGARDAMFLLERLGLKVVIKGYGTVKEQSPIQGTALRPNQTVYIRLEQ